MQVIGVHRKFWEVVLTLLVSRAFTNFLGAPRASADFRDSTAGYRIITKALTFANSQRTLAVGL